jgi:hypothetical protein
VAVDAFSYFSPTVVALNVTVTKITSFRLPAGLPDGVRISGESDHPFRLNPTTCFGGIRPGISVESDHLFR